MMMSKFSQFQSLYGNSNRREGPGGPQVGYIRKLEGLFSRVIKTFLILRASVQKIRSNSRRRIILLHKFDYLKYVETKLR